MSYLQPARKQGKQFLNPIPTPFTTTREMLRILPEFFFRRSKREPHPPLPVFRTDASIYATEPASGIRITWFGHSGMLLELDGFRLLIDPVWSRRASPVQFSGPERFFPPTIALTDLPPIDAILISHDHYDHLDELAVRALAQRNTPWITSVGVGKILQGYGVSASGITELNWTNTTTLASQRTGAKLNITSLPSRHFSGRSLFNRFQTLWGSFVLRTARHNLYFGADSGYWPGFAEIGEQYGPFDLTMLEIGASNPMWENIHLGPDNAARAHLDLRGKILFPIHWGLFDLALHEWREPIERLLQIAPEKGISIWVPTPGQPTEFAGQPSNSSWWQTYTTSETIEEGASKRQLANQTG